MSIQQKWQNNPLVYLFRKTWHYSEDNRRHVIWYWGLFIVANTINLVGSPLVFAKIMNTTQLEGITADNVRFLIGLLSLTLVFELVFWAMHGPARCLERNNAFLVRLNYRRFLLRGVMTLPMEWQADHLSGDTIDKIEKGTGALFSFSAESFQVIYSFVQLAVSYAILVYFSPPAAVIVMVMIGISIFATVWFDRILVGQYKDLYQAENQINASVTDAVTNITTVIILRVEKLVYQAIMGKAERPFALFTLNQRLNETKWFISNICCTVMTIIVLAVYFWQNTGTDEGVLAGSVFLLIQYLDRISDLFFRFTSMYSEILQQWAKVKNSEELSDDFMSENFTNHVLPPDWRKLEVENLSFSYHGDEADLHLDDLSLVLERGRRYAVVGSSGSGKTTLLKIIRDLYHPHSLRLEVDGRAIPDGFRGISRAIALVPQNPEIFASTIRENITLGADYDLDFIRRFTDMACLTGVIDSLPKKFDSQIKEKGVNLSGGQQQRLALSRGLLACHDKDIVLLDEPTSSLDAVTELKVYRNVFREFKGKTVISSVHRLHLLSLFHEILVFSEGRIVAAGTLEELLVASPEFQHMWQQYHEEHREEMV